ncbi:PR domain zinc finger protein 1 isoform X2 [Aplysia californica]|uniref:PR domain zinc finger protein 1 isoform X2 n=1 Tax=Aplysia californica TaxID=6500 RepID=A0ABM1VVP1_APLCA|nr:PR domain zinc finger protein 1 isoform X2 [Aplysia californica]
MDNLPPSGFQFTGDDYGPVDFPSSLPSEMQAGMAFAGGGPVFPQNQRGSSYAMSPFHMNYSQQASMPSMSSLPSSTFRTRFTDYPPDQSPHLPMPIPSSASGIISDRLPSFSSIVSSSGSSSADPSKSSQALYSGISSSLAGQQHAFQPSGSRGLPAHFDSSYSEQVPGKNYSKSSPLGSTSPGMSSSSNFNNIPHSSILQHSSHNGSGHLPALSPRSYKEEPTTQQQYLASMHMDRHGSYPHGALAGGQNPGESMTLPKFKHKYLSHSQPAPRRHIGPFKFYILGSTSRGSIINKGSQTNEENIGELKIKIPKKEIYRSDSETEMSDDNEDLRRRSRGTSGGTSNSRSRGQTSHASPRITFPYDPVPAATPTQNKEYSDYNKNSKMKTIISPSFMDSAGKATMTTCVANKATIVTVGIVSRPGKLHSAEPVNSQHRGIMSTSDGYRNKHFDPQHPENYEQLMEERKAKAKDLEQERMEVSVRIDDTQYVQVGNAKRWQCNQCDKSYTTKHNLVMHVLDHEGIKPHLCLKCGKYFKQLSHLNTHMLTHDQIKPHTCNMCGKGFTQISHLKRHTAVSEKNGYCANLRSKQGSSHHHSPSAAPPMGTPTALISEARQFQDQNQSFDSMEGYDRDDLKLSDDKLGPPGKLMCRYCDRKFRYPSQLKDHMQSHNGNRPYMCTECGMDFMKEHHLKAHQFTHTGLKPYTCDICGRSFNQRANLQRHKLIHETHRTFKCNTCGKLFTQPQTLKAHQVVHADRKPFECTICGNLNRHKKVKHGLNETTDVMEEDAVNFLSSLSERARDDSGPLDGDGECLSPGDGGDSGDGKLSRKGRKSIPRKITQGEEEEGAYPQGAGAPGEAGMPQDGAPKPFVIQNPDTDEEEEGGTDQGHHPHHHQGDLHKDAVNGVMMEQPGMGNPMMNFQPLNNAGLGQQLEEGEIAMTRKRLYEEEVNDMVDKRPRRQSQRRSPKVQAGDMQQSDSDEFDGGNMDNTDADWVPGSKRRYRSKVDLSDKSKMS